MSYTYQYDTLGRRDKVTREDASYWNYGYNDRHELLAGKKYFSDLTPAAGMQFEYGYDNIGNRQATKAGGNDLGAGLRNASYTANNLNQYTQRTVPGAFDVLGVAATGTTVTVNTQATYRKSDYFQKEVTVNNAAGPIYQQVDVVGAKNNAGGAGEDAVTTQSGKVYVPQATETYAYDFDGNLTQDGRWIYTWDAENRLTSMTAIGAAPVTAKRKLEFAYDYMGRLVEKKVYDWNVGTSAYVLASTTRFVYDGWNLMAEVDATGIVKKNYIWGQDLSGSSQGAGGIGGLLLIGDSGNVYQCGYDGNGNLTLLVKLATGGAVGNYDYDPMGNTLKQSVENSVSSSFGFSTKYIDGETFLIYYGHRYYCPQLGRWLSRDLIAEEGGINLVGFIANNPANNIDPIGLAKRGLVGDTIFYTCNCGWVDLGHLNPEGAKQLLMKIAANKGVESLSKKGFLVRYGQGAGIPKRWLGFSLPLYSTEKRYFVRYNLNQIEQESVALGIFKEVSESFEERQSEPIQDFLASSGFSGEDLVSNLLGFYRAAVGYSIDHIKRACKPLSKEDSLKVWDANNGIPKSRSWKPDYMTKGNCCKEKPVWPAQFDLIKEAPKGIIPNLWRDWAYPWDIPPGKTNYN